MRIDVGSVVKINPQIFGADPKESDLYGDLGYVGILRYFNFKVERLENDPNRGQGAFCTILNPKAVIGINDIQDVRYEGQLFVLMKDLVPAVVKVTLDYDISVKLIDNRDVVKELFVERNRLKELRLGVGHPTLRENWRNIQAVRKEIEKGNLTYYEGEASVRLLKQRVTIKVPSNKLPKEDDKDAIFEFKMYLARELSKIRSNRSKIVAKNKELFGEVVTMIGGVYTEGGQPMKAYEKSLLTTLRADKIPKTKAANYIGIEIEFIHLDNNPKIEELFIKNRLHKNVQLTQDMSVKPCHNARGYRGSELRVLATEKTAPDVISKVCRTLLHPLVDGYVNRSCGLHVHLDVRNRDAALVYKNLVRVMNLLKGSQPIGRSNSHFCIPNKYDCIDKTKDADEAGGNRKYLVVNPFPHLTGRSTIEVRVHEGSVDCEQITNWVMFLNCIANFEGEIPKKGVDRAKDLAKYIDLPAPCIEYIDRRIEKFGHVS